MEKKLLELLESKKEFPVKIDNQEGSILKDYFEFDKSSLGNQKDKSDLEYRYLKKIGEKHYVLIEEYIFKEGETFLKIENSIGRNYYLNKY